MRVLLQGRSARSIALTPGGDQVQIDETARALRDRFGVDARTSSELEPDLAGVDVVHLFGLVRPQEVWVQARNARRQGVPIVLSTVYCDVWEFEQKAREGTVGLIARHTNRDVMEALKAAGRGIRSREWGKGSFALFTRGFRSMQRDVLRMVSVFLPNSESEWERLSAELDFSCAKERVIVVPNGVDLSEIRAAADAPVESRIESFRGCVLCVARIEGRKNQLSLVEALAGTDLQLVLAGQPARNQPGYVTRVREAAERAGNVSILGSVTQDVKHQLYSVAQVHALPSWIETTGLSSLEAALLGCSLVVSPNGDTREYFRDDAEYCDPGEPASIRAAVLRAYDRPASPGLERRIRTSFTWDAAAEATLVAYERVIDCRRFPPAAHLGGHVDGR